MSSLHLVSHFFNEELLLKYWVKHHLPLADSCTMINHRSTDASVEIIRELAPHWKIVDTQLENFSAPLLEPEVQYWESQSNCQFKLTLNTTEFVFDPNFKDTVDAVFHNHKGHPNAPQAIGMRSFVMVDKKEQELDKDPLWRTRTYGYLDNPNPSYPYTEPTIRRWRYVHRAEHGHYQLGRHGTNLPHVNMWGMYLQWYGWSPWKQCRERKLQIQTRIPQWEKDAKLGFEHCQSPESLTELYNEHLGRSYNLLENEDFRRIYDGYMKTYYAAT